MEVFHITAPLWGESTGHWWIPLTKANDAELWCFLWSAPEPTNGWSNNRDASDLRCHHAHYDVTDVLYYLYIKELGHQWFRQPKSTLWLLMAWLLASPGARFNIKMSSDQYRKSHCGDKMVVRSSYLHSGISYTGKMILLYWIGPLVIWTMLLNMWDMLVLFAFHGATFQLPMPFHCYDIEFKYKFAFGNTYLHFFEWIQMVKS